MADIPTRYNAEIIAVGSEMLTSQRLDTNSLYIADLLNGLGVEVRRKLVIGDDRAALTEGVEQALAAAEILILSGGLGPTEDDLTRDAVAQALGRPLIFEQSICDSIEARFRRRGRVMAEINKRQAFLVGGAEMLPNPNGTAPGQWIPLENGKLVVLLPGPPNELKPMMAAECMPRLERMLPHQVIRTRFYRITGLTESDLDQLIAPVYSKVTNPVTTILAHMGDMQVHLRARAPKAEEAECLLTQIGDPMEALLGDRIYSRTGESLEEVAGRLLLERSATLSLAESLTGGMVGERITSVAGSSNYFAGGFLVYNDRSEARAFRSGPGPTRKTYSRKRGSRAGDGRGSAGADWFHVRGLHHRRGGALQQFRQPSRHCVSGLRRARRSQRDALQLSAGAQQGARVCNTNGTGSDPPPFAGARSNVILRDRYIWPAFAVATILFYFAPLFLSGASIHWDLADVTYPAQKYVEESFRAGKLPFWSPYLNSGTPFLADPQSGAWYPLHWPFFLIGITPRMLMWELALHTFLALGGTFLLVRRLLGSVPAALMAALLYAWSGYFAGRSSQLSKFEAAALLPWLLWSALCAMETGSPLYLGLAGLSGGLSCWRGTSLRGCSPG